MVVAHFRDFNVASKQDFEEILLWRTQFERFQKCILIQPRVHFRGKCSKSQQFFQFSSVLDANVHRVVIRIVFRNKKNRKYQCDFELFVECVSTRMVNNFEMFYDISISKVRFQNMENEDLKKIFRLICEFRQLKTCFLSKQMF